MKNIHLLKTDKPSRLAIQLDCKPKYNIQLAKKENDWTKNWEKQTIYIISDEYIGLSYYLDGDLVRKGVVDDKDYWKVRKDYKKIILTTDPQLIQDGVQAIDDEFLEWFVKNPSCEEVEVSSDNFHVGWEPDYSFENEGIEGSKKAYQIFYKIIIPKEDICSFCDGTGQVLSCTTISRFKTCDCKIIPKEEPKQNLEKEMFELEQELDIPSYLRWHNSKPKQQRMYSEEDLREAFRQGQDNMNYSEMYGFDSKLTEQEWLEQFLKKNKMKNIKYRILIGLCVFLYIYLMSSFFESSFNIKDWSEATRFTTSLFGGIFTIILPLMIPEDIFKNK